MSKDEWAFFILLFLFNTLAVIFKLFPPRKINLLYGYRTNKSMLSEENWKKANLIFSNFLVTAFISLTGVLLLIFFIFGITAQLVILELVGFIGVLISSIIYTERKI